MVIGRALGKTAEHDMRNAALSGANLRGDDANRDARCPIGWKSIDAGRYCREGNRCEPVRRRKIEGGAIAQIALLSFCLVSGGATSPLAASDMR